MNKERARNRAFVLLVSAPRISLGCKAVDIGAAVGGRTAIIGVLVTVEAVVVVCLVRAVCVCVCVCVCVSVEM